MTVDTTYKSGKSEHDENFPVASRIIAARYRAPVLAFYRFARAADDAADHPHLDQAAKFALLSALEDTLLGKSDAAADALPLRGELQRTGITSQHALDLLRAFRQDVTKSRYNTWAELIDYCRYSAMPVGRFVLDVHGEPKSTWEPSDALCTALQIINHLQDCGKDYREHRSGLCSARRSGAARRRGCGFCSIQVFAQVVGLSSRSRRSHCRIAS